MKNILSVIFIVFSLTAIAGGGGTTTGIGGGARTALGGGGTTGGVGGPARIDMPLIIKNQLKTADLSTPEQRQLLWVLARMSRPLQGDLVVLGTVGWSMPASVTTTAPQFEIQWPNKLTQYNRVQWPRSPWNSLAMIDETALKGAKTGDFVVAFRDQLVQAEAGRSRLRAFVIPKMSIPAYDQRDFQEMLSKQIEQYPYFK
ncbi:MAG: hypothetical protein IT288_10825 [Bdellovibrionales bacterium]|nr:hypothetical protein [Bdellovibrionales bacterium]